MARKRERQDHPNTSAGASGLRPRQVEAFRICDRAATREVEDEAVDELVVLVLDLGELRVPEGLTPAERAIVELVAQGFSNQEIAERRGCSTRTVANQMATLLAKLGVENRVALIAAVTR